MQIVATIQVAASIMRMAWFSVSTMNTLPANTYNYDVWRTDSGSEAVLSIGQVQVRPSVRVP